MQSLSFVTDLFRSKYFYFVMLSLCICIPLYNAESIVFGIFTVGKIANARNCFFGAYNSASILLNLFQAIVNRGHRNAVRRTDLCIVTGH
jgi:hypothetical protein